MARSVELLPILQLFCLSTGKRLKKLKLDNPFTSCLCLNVTFRGALAVKLAEVNPQTKYKTIYIKYFSGLIYL